MRIEERPSVELRDWLYNDLVVTFWESRPKIEKVREEGQEVAVDRVVLDSESGLPVIETLNHGVSKINLIDWLKKSPLHPSFNASQKSIKNNQEAQTPEAENLPPKKEEDKEFIHKFVRFYPSELLSMPEFRYENKLDEFSEKDMAMFKEYLAQKEALVAQIKAE
mmetsp:Transcript_17877/g.30379  ORF Transcript_17877/g.30379 Transcript_17877/m.30379 type:complete len:165 (+) Transcript_17877:1198-1692(+)